MESDNSVSVVFNGVHRAMNIILTMGTFNYYHKYSDRIGYRWHTEMVLETCRKMKARQLKAEVLYIRYTGTRFGER